MNLTCTSTTGSCLFLQRLPSQRGFTFIEMLIAVAIFAMVGLAAANVLSSVTTSNEISAKQSERLQEIQMAMLTIERDLRQATKRKVRVNGEKPVEAFISHGELILDSQSEVLALRRVGWINPMNLLPRSEVQSLAYRVVEDTLERLHYDFPDPMVGEEYQVRPLLSGVTAIKFEFTEAKKLQWQKTWEEKDLPAAISMTLTLDDMGDVTRIFLLPGGA